MSRLVGAEQIARKLSELAGVAVSKWQVYRLANARGTPVDRDRERWRIQVSAEELETWWSSSRLAANFANRLRAAACPRQGARMRTRPIIPAYGQPRAAHDLHIVGVVGDGELTTSAFLEKLKVIEGDIRLLVNSNGGLVADGLAIYHALRTHDGTVDVEIIGVAASMASAIAMAGDTVRMAEDGLFMLHDPWAGAVGNADDLRAAADMLEKHGDSLAGIYARRTKYTEAQILDLMGHNGGEGTWMNAEEALEAGFVDEILAPAAARLPQIPAAALSKRITVKGDRTMNEFLKRLAELIKALVKGDTTRDDVVDELAVQAEMQVEHVTEVLDGKRNPTLPQLRAFADVLGVKTKDLRGLAEKAGIKLEAPKRQPASLRSTAIATDPGGQGNDLGQAVRDALVAERTERRRIENELRAEAERHGLPATAVTQVLAEADDLADGRSRILNWLADPQNRNAQIIRGGPGQIVGGQDDREKWLDGMSQWLVIKSGNRGLVEAHAKKEGRQVQLDAGEFRGYTLVDIARNCLEVEGINCRGMSSNDIAGELLRRVKASVILGPRGDGRGLGTTSDFPILLENALHKMLQAAYMTSPDKWRSIAATGTVNDFRPHPRLRLGSLSRLDALLESGEYKYKHFPDAEKEVIQAATQGNIIGLTRQSIVNDDVDGFTRLVVMLGRAAGLSIELDVFALFGLNSGAGPTMQDSNPLFHASHNNIASTAGTVTQALLDESRILMAQQTDPSGNEILDLRPAVWVGPIAQGAATRAAVTAEFDFDAETSGNTGKFMKPNTVRDLVSTIVDTPRLTGTRWYLLADPSVAPVFEVVFLQGAESPVIEVMEGFDFDGVKWRIKHDFGVGATDHRGATTNPGQ